MRIFKSIPKNETSLKFNGGLLKLSIALAIFCQIVSATTETGIFYNSFQSKFTFLGSWGLIPSLILTFGFVAGLELGGRTIISYAADFILYRRFNGINLYLGAFSIIVAIGLLYTSLNVSLMGTPTIVRAYEIPPKLENTFLIDSIFQNKRDEAKVTYSSDSFLIASNYDKQIEANQKEYLGKIGMYAMSIANWERKEERTGKSYSSKKNYLKGKIATLEGERDGTTLKLESQKMDELKRILSHRKSQIKEAERVLQSEKKKVATTNKERKEEHNTTITANEDGLSFLVIACILLFPLMIVINRMIYKEAGIAENHQLSDYFFRGSFISAYFAYLSEKINQFAFSKIDQWSDRIPQPILSEKPNTVFDRSGNTKYVLVEAEAHQATKLVALNSNIKFDERKYLLSSEYNHTNSNLKESINIQPLPTTENGEQLERMEFEIIHHAKNGDEVTARQVIESYLDAQGKATKKNIDDLIQNVKRYIAGEVGNPFERRRAIGFHKDGDDSLRKNTYDNRMPTDKDGTNLRTCEHCGTVYKYKHNKQKYCKETCRKAAWKAKNGRDPMMRKRK